TQVRQALARPRTAHALRPSAASSQRIIGDLRSTKWSARREERYRILSSHHPEVILCNNTKMLRERLDVSGEKLGTAHREREDDYVYDLYYQETVTPGWIQDILFRIWWSMKRKSMMTKMMKMKKATGGMTTLMRTVIQTVTKRNATEYCDVSQKANRSEFSLSLHLSATQRLKERRCYLQKEREHLSLF
ncbi:hypothetical protein XENOCAPTIV_012603, partial [Xenoophorus captivus]